MDLHSLWYLVAAILVIVGLIGTVLPALPGVPLVFCGLLLAAWADGFAHVGAFTLFVLGVLTVIAIGIDFLAGVLGAKKVGASRYAVIGAALLPEIIQAHAPSGRPAVAIGAKNFSEQYILADLMTKRLRSAGYSVTTKSDLGKDGGTIASR